jgi:hypothetical protein
MVWHLEKGVDGGSLPNVGDEAFFSRPVRTRNWNNMTRCMDCVELRSTNNVNASVMSSQAGIYIRSRINYRTDTALLS